MIRLSGPEIATLVGLLREAFPRARFTEFLLYRLNRRTDDVAGEADDYPTVLRKVVQEANAGLWWRDLLREARNAVPADPGLLAFAEQFGLSPAVAVTINGGVTPIHGPQLELKIKSAQSTFDILTWRKRLGEIEGRVCRVEFPEKVEQGTGFLVAPNVVLTNYHVVQRIHEGKVDPSDLACRFDYKVLEDGLEVHPGTVYRPAGDWLVDWSPYSPRDLEVNPAGDPSPDELDYALIHLQGRPGEDPVGGETNDPRPTARGWVEVPGQEHDFAAQPALYIVQHPDGRPMKVAIDTEAVLGLNGNATRVRYTTTTEPGSSGSPCFGPDWEWVALHHSGDPKYRREGKPPTFNQGIPLPAIRALLDQRGKGQALGGGV